MITFTRITDCNSNEYDFIEKLLVDTFPKEEYRDLDEQRNNTCCNDIFNLVLIKDDETPIGFISFWDFNRFRYVEHFAIQPQMRNKKFGKRAMEMLQQLSSAIVLEAEEPLNETATRRIEFYRRMGFVPSENEYMQPPYRRNGEKIKMRLLFWGNVDAENNFEYAKEIIYKNVYLQHGSSR